MPQSTINPDFDASVLHAGTTNWTTSVGANGTAIDITGAVLLQQAVFGGNYVCERIYTLWDTTGISTGATLTSANIQYYMTRSRGTQTGVDVMKLFDSTDLSSSSAVLYQTFGTNDANTATTVGTSGNAYKTFTIDGDLLAYFQTQVSAGNKCATLLRAQTDYDNASVADPTVVNYRQFELDNNANDPILTINYDVGGYGNNVGGVSSGNIAKINGVATADISKVSGV